MNKFKRIIELVVLGAAIIMAFSIIPKKVVAFLNNKAIAYFHRGKTEKAIFLIESALKIKPTKEGYYNLACSYEKIDMPDKAVVGFKKTLEIDPYFKPAVYGVIDIYQQQGRYEEAISFLKNLPQKGDETLSDDLKKINRQYVHGLYNEAVALYNTGRNQQATSKLKQVLVQDPTFVFAHVLLADEYSKQEQLEKAIAHYQQAINLGFDHAQIYNNSGICYMLLGDYNAAVKYLKIAYHLDAENIHIAYSLASTLRDKGDFTGALSLYEEIKQSCYDYPNLHNDLAGIYENLDYQDKAEEEYREEIKIIERGGYKNSKDIFILNRLATAYNGLSQVDEARAIIDQALAIDPEFREAYFTRAEIYKKSGQQAQALADLEKAKNINRPNLAYTQLPKIKRKDGIIMPNPQNLNFRQDTEIYLKNGRKITGRLKADTPEKIVLEVVVGNSFGTVSFNKDNIHAVNEID